MGKLEFTFAELAFLEDLALKELKENRNKGTSLDIEKKKKELEKEFDIYSSEEGKTIDIDKTDLKIKQLEIEIKKNDKTIQTTEYVIDKLKRIRTAMQNKKAPTRIVGTN